MVDPIIKWAGGKRQLLPQLLDRIGKPEGTYFEPFIGGGALFLALEPRKAVINDTNRRLTALYSVIAEDLDAFRDHLDILEYRYNKLGTDEERREMYLRARDHLNGEGIYKGNQANFTEAAALLVFLNKCGFNGLYRENSRGRLNVPWGKKEKVKLYDEMNLEEMSLLLQRTDIENCDFVNACRKAKAGDTVFLDPPYDQTFTGYSSRGFDAFDQERVAQLFRDLTERGCRVIATNSDTPLIRRLYEGFDIERVDVRRSISRDPGCRRGVEVIIDNRNVL